MQTIAYNLGEIVITPTLAGSGAYSTGKQVGGLQTLVQPTFDQGRFAMLTGLTIIDNDNQKAALTIVLFNALPLVTSVDQGTFAITNADLALKCIAQIPIVVGDYQSLASGAVATHTYTNLFVKSQDPQGLLYAAVVTTGTPTYTTTSSLCFKWNFAKQF